MPWVARMPWVTRAPSRSQGEKALIALIGVFVFAALASLILFYFS